ncbi:hypothetical protein D3C75_840620 [compost metagenome]
MRTRYDDKASAAEMTTVSFMYSRKGKVKKENIRKMTENTSRNPSSKYKETFIAYILSLFCLTPWLDLFNRIKYTRNSNFCGREKEQNFPAPSFLYIFDEFWCAQKAVGRPAAKADFCLFAGLHINKVPVLPGFDASGDCIKPFLVR